MSKELKADLLTHLQTPELQGVKGAASPSEGQKPSSYPQELAEMSALFVVFVYGLCYTKSIK